MQTIDTLIAYEQGELDEEDTVLLFAELVRTGLAWSLQGHYGRTAAHLIESGLLMPDGALTSYALGLFSDGPLET